VTANGLATLRAPGEFEVRSGSSTSAPQHVAVPSDDVWIILGATLGQVVLTFAGDLPTLPWRVVDLAILVGPRPYSLPGTPLTFASAARQRGDSQS